MSASEQDERIKRLEDEINAIRLLLSTKFDQDSKEIDIGLEDKMLGLVQQIKSQDSIFSRRPTLSLLCRPTRRTEIRGIFGGYREDIVKLFDNPPELREGGFDLVTTGRSSVNVGGEYRLLNSPGYQARFLSREGICGVIVNGGDDFMGWAMNSTASVAKFNSMTLAEITYSFCKFALDLLNFGEPKPEDLKFYIQLDQYDENGIALALPKGRVSLGRVLETFPSREIGKTNLIFCIDAKVTDRPEKVGLRLLQELYVKFGFETDMVPYADSNKENIDIEAIMNSR
jgi:hypothetical protein